MLYTEEQITAEILADKDYVLGHEYPTDLAHEYADSSTPIWHDDILMTWRDLPRDDKDTHEGDSPEGMSIFSLMAMDIYTYYQGLYYGAIEKLLEEEGGN